MTRLAGNLRTDLPAPDVLVACAEAIEGLGWRIDDVESGRIVSRAGTGTRRPPRIEVVVGKSGKATEVWIIGTDRDADPIPRETLVGELDRVRDAIEASLKRATGAARQGPPITTRMGIAAAVGLLVIGLGIVGVAAVNDASEDTEARRQGIERQRDQDRPPRDREGNRSTGTSDTETNQSQPDQDQEAPASSPPDLGETKRIRDGDSLFELTPTDMAREGEYITLEIEVTGLGNRGYDPAGPEFLGTLLGSDGQSYRVQGSGGPGGCEPPLARLTNGRTLDGCLPFKVPQGVEADRFQYQPFFLGVDAVQWDLG